MEIFRCFELLTLKRENLLWCKLQVVQEALDKAKLSERDLSGVAVTIGPGLSLCLRGNLNNVVFFFF